MLGAAKEREGKIDNAIVDSYQIQILFTDGSKEEKNGKVGSAFVPEFNFEMKKRITSNLSVQGRWWPYALHYSG